MNPSLDVVFARPEWGEGFLDIKVYWKNTDHEVAYVRCRHNPDGILELEDIVVRSHYKLPERKCFQMFRRSAPLVDFRGIGIGSELLKMVISEARKANVASIWGSIVETDPVIQKRLLRWYQRFGFKADAPDGRCLPNACKLVVLDL